MFNAPRLLSYLNYCWLDPYAVMRDDEILNLWKFFEWFKPTDQWRYYLRTHHQKYVLITFNKPLKLLPHDPEAPIQDEPNESPYNNTVIQAWYSYNLAKTTRASWNEDWYEFLSIMCDCNNVQVDSIHPEIF